MMKIRPMKRALTVALLTTTTVVAIDGCTAVKKMSPSQPVASEETPKKEYNWQDMSTGKSSFRPINKPNPQ
jgi:hypothetical protein